MKKQKPNATIANRLTQTSKKSIICTPQRSPFLDYIQGIKKPNHFKKPTRLTRLRAWKTVLEDIVMIKQGRLSFIGTVENADETEARVRIFPEYCEGLKEINRFSHLIILYWIHLRDKKKDRSTLHVTPRRHAVNMRVGVFACRSPSRPNPIGLSVVKLVRINECNLTVNGLDAIQGSPIIDIKPYIPRSDSVPDARAPKWTLDGPLT